MIILNNPNEIAKSIDFEIEFLKYNIKSQSALKNIILKYMQNFADSKNFIDLNLVTCVTEFLENLKLSIDLCNENIKNLNSLLNELSNINTLNQNDNENTDDKLSAFMLKYYDLNRTIMENSIKIEECIYSISEKSDLKFNAPLQSDEASSEPSDLTKISDTESHTQDLPSANDNKNKNSNYEDNTLIVSQTSGSVILPYKLSELQKILQENPNKYSSIDEIIVKDYTLPISLFKNPFIARFRESFKLMKNKEKRSVADSFELGIELMFNYNLHPAIISACRNLDELDIYLDYLESGETNKFNCFKVVFELPPTIVK